MKTQSGQTTRYVYGLDGTYLHRHHGTKRTDYVRAAGMVIARIQNDRITYPHHDHLGSPLRETNANGNGKWSEAYTPYGSQRGGSTGWNDDQPSFTGHVEDRSTGLTYMQARYYDPVAMRFLAPDPVQFSPARPDMFGRYGYAAGDPVNNTDPTGMCPWCVVGAIIGGGAQLVAEVKSGSLDLSDGLQLSDAAAVGRVGLSAGAGALGVGTGARIVAMGSSTAGRTLAGMAGGGVGAGIAETGKQANEVGAGRASLGEASNKVGIAMGTGIAAGGLGGFATTNVSSQVDEMVAGMATYAETVVGIATEAKAAEDADGNQNDGNFSGAGRASAASPCNRVDGC